MRLGDIHGLRLALEASEGARAEALAVEASAELARLEGVEKRFGAPARGSMEVHFEKTEGGWVAHELRVDSSGRLTILTKARWLNRFNSSAERVYFC